VEASPEGLKKMKKLNLSFAKPASGSSSKRVAATSLAFPGGEAGNRVLECLSVRCSGLEELEVNGWQVCVCLCVCECACVRVRVRVFVYISVCLCYRALKFNMCGTFLRVCVCTCVCPHSECNLPRRV
jgi:hypothetical protein